MSVKLNRSEEKCVSAVLPNRSAYNNDSELVDADTPWPKWHGSSGPKEQTHIVKFA